MDRVRIAVAAAVVSGALLAAGASWLVEQMELQVERQIVADADARANEGAHRLARLLVTTGDLAAVRSTGAAIGPYEVVDREHDVVASCPPTESPVTLGSLSGPSRVLRGYTTQIHVDPDRHDCVMPSLWRDGGVLEVRVATVATERYDVRVAAPIGNAERTAVDGVRELFQTLVPAAALLIGVLAWLATTTSDTFVRLGSALDRQRRFTSDASHELRTPLASARTQLEVLLAHPDRVDWRRTAENTVLDLDRMQAVVTDLLLLARLEHRAAEHRATARVDLAELAGVPGPVEVLGDRAHLERVLRNLLDNAERHASAQVTVTVAVEGGTAVLRVADDGPGITEADRERVFEPFVRLDEGRARDEGGAGLGLAIVREGVRAHGGTVAIEDGDRGTVVAVRLPLA
ncbi:HAMP domain-containing sensor histidine kinase [Actinosynnema sp. NPDC023794]